MIGIDKIQTIRTDMSVVIVCNSENLNSLREGVLSKQQLEYIRQEYANKGMEFFSFNELGRYIFVGIVKQTDIDYKDKEKYRRLGAKILQLCDRKHVKDIQLLSTIHKDMILGFVEGMLLSSYVFDTYKTDPKRLIHPFDNLHICDKDISMEDIQSLRIVCEATEKCRDMINEPVTVINATTLAESIKNMGQETGMQVEIWDKTRIEKEKMGGILAVNRGSVEPPTFTIMEYKPKEAKNSRPIVLVGKGIVYDTGGLNIKTGNFMNDMKDDMSGAALMSCVMYACARLNIPIHIIGLFPATDNRPGQNAYVNGDIINMYDGTNVEVVNTDAEGRMILADALAFAKQYNPSLVIDAATLTGAAARAIGPFGIAAIEKDAESFMEVLKTCGKRVYERIAEFPFWDEYDECIKSEIADIKNSGESFGGMITAGKFLAYFTNYPFIHLDIAGVSFTNKRDAYNRLHATGYGLRLLVEFLKTYHN
ncbi:MAG: leucyl aminopeptidase family protein [Bacteroidota bacterium]|nr:leucyl aminopeptidase family protein [Bacteroidota bacterium]